MSLVFLRGLVGTTGMYTDNGVQAFFCPPKREKKYTVEERVKIFEAIFFKLPEEKRKNMDIEPIVVSSIIAKWPCKKG